MHDEGAVSLFWKRHAKAIMNILVALLVLAAIYAKMETEGTESLVRTRDGYILIGSVVVLIVLHRLTKRQQKK
ncbi:hypothetical protein DWX75_03620 [Mitsuokella sp. AF21-1AC]|nr:hypothetical protein DWX75_03620 [Mitsuokella sp. AF21-1AC]